MGKKIHNCSRDNRRSTNCIRIVATTPILARQTIGRADQTIDHRFKKNRTDMNSKASRQREAKQPNTPNGDERRATLQFLLCVFWLATILPIAAAVVLPIIAAAGGRTFRRLFCTLLARGKTVKASSSSMFAVPQKYFLHFYAMGVAVTTSLLLAVWFYAYMKMAPLVPKSPSYSTIASRHVGGSNSFSLSNALSSHPLEHKCGVWRTVFVLILMEIQVLRRLYETKHVFHYSPTAQMHILLYLGSFSYYVAAPLSLASPCLPEAMQYLRYQIDEFTVKDQARMLDLVIDPSNLMRPLLKLGWCEWIGAAIFIWGSLHQFRCHAILGSLREHKDSDDNIIPCGDWFSRVSCPHYLAEIVIYFGLLIASGGSNIPVWFMLLFVIMNLSFSAVQTHKWYLQKFEDYPRSRYALRPVSVGFHRHTYLE